MQLRPAPTPVVLASRAHLPKAWHRSRWWEHAWSFVVAAPAVALVAVCCGLPLGWIVGVLLTNPAVRRDVAPSAFRMELLLRTLGYNGAVAVLATAMSLPAALVLGRGRGALAKVLWVVLPAALLMPSLAYAYGWSQFVRLARPVFEPLGVTFVPEGPADVARCVWTLAAWLWPVPAGLIGLALRRMDTGVQLHALLDGALLRVTLRQLLAPILASAAIVMLLATQEFSVYEPTGIKVVATEIRMVFETGAFSSLVNPMTAPVDVTERGPEQAGRAAAAVATAVPLLVITALLAGLAAWGATRLAGSEAVAVGAWPRALDAPGWAIGTSLLLVVVTVGVPVGSLLMALKSPLSATRAWGVFGPQVAGAVAVGGLALAVAGVMAFAAAARWTPGLLVLAGASFLIGGQLLAIGLIRIYNRPGLMWAYDAFPVPVLAYAARFGWLALAGARGTWTEPWRDLRQMAAVDGAGPVRTAMAVVWPLAWPGLVAGALLVGALSLTEVPATVLLSPQHPQVLTPMLMSWVHMARYDPMIEASLLMMAMVLLPAIGVVGLVALGRGRGPLVPRDAKGACAPMLKSHERPV